MPKFDVINDSWIDVRYLTGEEKTVSLRQAFKDARSIKTLNIKSGSYIDEYCVYCLLYVFFQRSHKIENPRSLGHLSDTGFDMQKFDEYVSIIRETTSTNLFDETRPWMQMKDPDKPNEVGDINSLLPPIYPRGNNAVSFRLFDDPVNGRVITPQQYILGLLRLHRVAPMGGRGYSSSILTSIEAPVMVIPLGNNLLETIVAGTPLYSSQYESEKPFWEIEGGYVAKEDLFGAHSWAANAFIPTRYINWLDVTDDGFVTKAHCRPIRYKDMYKRTYWAKRKLVTLQGMEPHILKAEQLLSVKPDNVVKDYDNSDIQYYSVYTLGKMQASMLPLITDIAGLSGSAYRYQLNMSVAEQVLSKGTDVMRYKLYGVAYKKAVTEEQYMREIELPFIDMDASDPNTSRKNDVYQKIVAYADSRRKILNRAVVIAFGEDGIEPSNQSKRLKEMIAVISSKFGIAVSDYFREEAIAALGSVEDEDGFENWESETAKWVKRCSIETFRDNLSVVRNNPVAFEKALSVLSNGSKSESMPDGWAEKFNDLKNLQGVLKGLPKRHLLMLRNECGKAYEDANINAKIVFSTLPGTALKDIDKRFKAVTILATAYAREFDNPQVLFEEHLADLYKRNPSSAMRVNRFLLADDPWGGSALTTIITIAKGKTCDICHLLADMYYWDNSKERWANIIGKEKENNDAR